MSTILEQRKQRERDFAAEKLSAWRQLVADCCSGESRPADEVDGILIFCERSTGDLEKAIAHFQNRLGWKSDLLTGESAAMEFAKLGDELNSDAAETHAKIAAINRSLQDRQTARKQRMQVLEITVNGMHDASVRLRESLDPEFQQSIVEVQNRIKILCPHRPCSS